MKILIHSEQGNGLALVGRLLSEGHEVFAYIKEKIDKRLFDGMVNKIDNMKEVSKINPDLIFFDMVKDGKVADALRKDGYLVLGGGEFNDKIELDRLFGMKVMDEVGIQTPHTIEMNSLDKAIGFIKKNPDRYVIKVNDNQTVFSSYASKSFEDMINMLEHFKREELVDESKGFVIQKFIEGYEISTEGWFDGEKFIPEMFNHCIEEKKFLTGSLGSTTGSEGSVVFINNDMNDNLIKNVLKIEDYLRDNKYTGAIDVNTIVDKNGGMWALEFCARTGYVCLENMLELFEGDFGEFLYSVATGTSDKYKVKVSKDYCIGVLLSLPPYPHTELPSDISDEEAFKIIEKMGRRGLNLKVSGMEDFMDSCYFSGIYCDENKDFRIAMCEGYVGPICARGKTVDIAKKLVYERLDKINLPDKQYRIDIGDRAKEWLNGLNKKTKNSSEKEFDESRGVVYTKRRARV